MASIEERRVVSGLHLSWVWPVLVVKLVSICCACVSHAWIGLKLAITFFLVRLAVIPVGCLLQQELRCLGLLGEELREGFGEFLAFQLLLLVELLEVSHLGLNFLQSKSLFLLFIQKLTLLLGKQRYVAL